MLTVSTQCAPEETRTPNLLIRSQMLYPLSYGRMLLALAHNVVQNTPRLRSTRIDGELFGQRAAHTILGMDSADPPGSAASVIVRETT